jgi:hypothetical protein
VKSQRKRLQNLDPAAEGRVLKVQRLFVLLLSPSGQARNCQCPRPSQQQNNCKHGKASPLIESGREI